MMEGYTDDACLVENPRINAGVSSDTPCLVLESKNSGFWGAKTLLLGDKNFDFGGQKQ